MIPKPQIEAVMSTVLDACHAAVASTDYRLVGTAAAALHGVPLPTADIDILLKARTGVDAFSAALSQHECLSPPQYLTGSQQYFAAFKVHGLKVEFSTVEAQTLLTTAECIGPGPWRHFTLAPCGRLSIPTVALELRLLTELSRHRPDCYVPLWQFLQCHGFDTALLRRGLKERGISHADHIDLTPLTNPVLPSR